MIGVSCFNAGSVFFLQFLYIHVFFLQCLYIHLHVYRDIAKKNTEPAYLHILQGSSIKAILIAKMNKKKCKVLKTVKIYIHNESLCLHKQWVHGIINTCVPFFKW